MADWIKLFEDELSCRRLQWAIRQRPSTAPVYFALLLEFAKAKSERIPWRGDRVDHEGLGHQVGLSGEEVEAAVATLVEANKLRIEPGLLLYLPDFEARQSEYCRRRSKHSGHSPDGVPTSSGRPPDTVGTPSGQSRTKETLKRPFKVHSLEPEAGAGPLEALQAIGAPPGEKSLVDYCQALLGGKVMKQWGGKWRLRARENPGKLTRLLLGLQEELRSGRTIIRDRGAWANDMWARLAD